MRIADIGTNRVMVIDGTTGNKYAIYEITPERARMVEQRGLWTTARAKMAWNKAKQFLTEKSLSS